MGRRAHMMVCKQKRRHAMHTHLSHSSMLPTLPKLISNTIVTQDSNSLMSSIRCIFFSSSLIMPNELALEGVSDSNSHRET